MKRPVAVDILLPVYNAAATLRQSVGSLQQQDLREFRLIAIDDGSTDGSGDILKELARSDDRIEVLSRSNGGIVDALNAGLAICTAEYVARQDADDISVPSRLGLEVSYLDINPACAAVSGTIQHINEAGRLTGHVEYFHPERADPLWFPAREPYLAHPFLMARRSAMSRVGGYRHACHSEDTDLYWRLLACGYLHSLNESIGWYRMHSSSISGGSIVDGRIMAMSSQLATLSAIRRQAGKVDIVFEKGKLARYRAAKSLKEIIELGSVGLTRLEASHLRTATSLKLVDMSTYRPYELTAEDCRYIRAAVADYPEFTAENKSANNHLIAKKSALLIRKGLFSEARLLTPAVAYSSLVPRLMFNLMPLRLQATMKNLRLM